MKRIVLLVAMLAMLAFLAAPALAQGPPENPGVETGTEHARSIFSFSGLKDDPNEAFPFGGQTQSYGQIVSKLVKIGVNVNAGDGPAAPGIECNPNTGPSGPFTESVE